MTISYSTPVVSTLILLLTACGGGGGGDITLPPPPPITLEPWTGPASYMAYKPETLDSSSLLPVSSIDGAVMLDGKKRNFQSKQNAFGFNFTADSPWAHEGSSFNGGSEQLNEKIVNYLVYADKKSRADIGNGLARSNNPAMDFIALCSPEQQHFLINATAIRLSDINDFLNKSLSSQRYQKGTCAEEGRRQFLIFDNAGAASEVSTGSATLKISAEDFRRLLLGLSLPTADNQGERTMRFYKFKDSNGDRLAIQEFGRYPTDSSKNYIRIWY